MDSQGKSLKGKTPVQDPINKKPEKDEKKRKDTILFNWFKEEEDLNLKKNQAMDSQGNSPVQAQINNKPEEEEKMDECGFSLLSFLMNYPENQATDSGKSLEVKIPEQAPINIKPEKEEEGGGGEVQQKTIERRRKQSTPQRLTPST